MSHNGIIDQVLPTVFLPACKRQQKTMLMAPGAHCGTLCGPELAEMSKSLNALTSYSQTFAPSGCLLAPQEFYIVMGILLPSSLTTRSVLPGVCSFLERPTQPSTNPGL